MELERQIIIADQGICRMSPEECFIKVAQKSQAFYNKLHLSCFSLSISDFEAKAGDNEHRSHQFTIKSIYMLRQNCRVRGLRYHA